MDSTRLATLIGRANGDTTRLVRQAYDLGHEEKADAVDYQRIALHEIAKAVGFASYWGNRSSTEALVKAVKDNTLTGRAMGAIAWTDVLRLLREFATLAGCPDEIWAQEGAVDRVSRKMRSVMDEYHEWQRKSGDRGELLDKISEVLFRGIPVERPTTLTLEGRQQILARLNAVAGSRQGLIESLRSEERENARLREENAKLVECNVDLSRQIREFDSSAAYQKGFNAGRADALDNVIGAAQTMKRAS